MKAHKSAFFRVIRVIRDSDRRAGEETSPLRGMCEYAPTMCLHFVRIVEGAEYAEYAEGRGFCLSCLNRGMH